MTPEEWKPIGIKELEDAAYEAVRNDTNELVVAGPGAGKTELLAQKACYLLQTETCPYPMKILALTFKVDAAKNIKKRIDKRLNNESRNRFISETYEAFFLRLIKQFNGGLPEEWKVFSDLNLKDFDNRAGEERTFLDGCEDEKLSRSFLQTINANTLENDFLINKPISEYNPRNINDYIALKIWKNMLRKNRLTYKMVPRLAEFILDNNPYIIQCLQRTYRNIFIDEFQDTTSIQYYIIKKMFNTKRNIITAVGDDNQRIMAWAGAMDGIFTIFEKDYKAKVYRLKNNYRSIPALVDIQNNITQLFTKQQIYKSVYESDDSVKDPCIIYFCENETNESLVVCNIIKDLLNDCKPSDICLLTRTNNERYTKNIIEALNKNGIKIRNENELQSLLKEPVINLICSIIRIAYSYNYKDDFLLLKNYFLNNKTIQEFEIKTKEIIEIIKKDTNPFELIFDKIIEYLDTNLIKKSFPQYKKSNFLLETINNFKQFIQKNLQKMNLLESINDLIGDSYIPIMTIHKSKGLEFDNIILVGLEDNAFWNYNNNPSEENCTFFVAFSRAKKRVYFTITKYRTNQWGRQEYFSVDNIKPIIDVLNKSNVKLIKDKDYLNIP